MRHTTNPFSALLLVSLIGVGTPTLALQVSVNGASATCGNNTGYAYAYAWGGVPPYTYSWSNGAQSDTITGLAPGNYTVTVTDSNFDEATDGIIIVDLPSPVLPYSWTTYGLQGCQGQCNGGIWYDEAGMPLNLVPPFSFSIPPTFLINPLDILQGAWVGFCPGFSGTFTTVTDGLGCVAQLQLTEYDLPSSDPSPMSVVNIVPSCAGMSGGSIVVNVGQDNGAVGPNWETRLLDAALQPVPGVNITADPVIGWNIATVSNRPPGDYHIERRFPNMYSGDCVDLMPVTVPSLGADCGMVSGTAFIDADENCLLLASEVRVPLGFVEVQPGPYFAPFASNGSYSLSLPTGSFSLSQISPSVAEHCTGAPIPFTINAGTTTLRNLPDTSVVALDLETVISSGAARPGFEFQYGITVRNLTPTASGNTTLSLTFDPLLAFVGATPNGSVLGSTITWTQSSLGAWQQRNYIVRLNVPSDPGLLGTELIGTASVSSVNPDGDLTNNIATNYRTITGSYDPNDKLAQTSSQLSDEVYYIVQDEWIDYTIRFQNTGTDTAFNILITDTLPGTLDPTTIHMGAGSHPFSWELRDQGTLKFYFQNIQLPDSNFSEPLSHGFVGFRIRPHQPIVPGTVIENIANIYFDFNPPVITEPSVLVAEFSTGVVEQKGSAIALAPVPASEELIVSSADVLCLVRILSADGREVLRMNGRSTQVRIDLGALPCGAYLLEAGLKNNTVARERFIKQ
ncbi:MAG: hypothetical protein IPK70_14025 [Flavobacteriales bacterium]|jgi:hypothetical protein|nr:hypothetical protein [Flavobacteriales bacterium]